MTISKPIRLSGPPSGTSSSTAHTRIPVYRGNIDSIIGMIFIKEVLRYLDSGKDLYKKFSEIPLSEEK